MVGKLIAFEGGEGAGKTTQIKLVREWLRGCIREDVPLIVTREPGGTPLGEEIRALLLGEQSPHSRTELLLYAADRAQHVEEMLKPQLARGAIILCDRYVDSTVAYQGYGRGLDLNLIDRLNQIATGGLESDLTFWLKVDVEIGLQRVQQRGARDRLERADLDFHRRVQQGFAALAKAYPHRIVPIAANSPAAEVQGQIRDVLTQKLQLAPSVNSRTE